MNIVIAQLNYTIGDFAANTAKIVNVILQQNDGTDLIIFSELCLSGYCPLDLIDRKNFIEAQNNSLSIIIEASKQSRSAIMLGGIEKNLECGKPYFNALWVIYAGEIIFKYHKKLLPVYNIFNEARYFEPGVMPNVFHFKNKRIGVLICEDAWADSQQSRYAVDPVSDLAAASLDLVVSINASPSNFGKITERQQQFCAITKRCAAPVIFVNQVGGYDDIIFDGASFVLDCDGRQLGQLPLFTEAVGTLSCETNSCLLTTGFIQPKILSNPEFAYEQILLGLRDYLKKCNIVGVVIGLSGGIDSAITLALAVDAIGADKVVALFLPSEFTAEQSGRDALALARNLGVRYYVRSIQDEFEIAKIKFQDTFDQEPSNMTLQNIQARLRGRILMEYSNQTGSLLISTGNKSELSVGFTTLYGDLAGGFNVIGDLYKTEVYELAYFYNQKHHDELIPRAILERAPTPELAFNQYDQDSLPPYELLDAVLKLFIEGDLLSVDEFKKCQLIQSQMSESLVKALHRKVDLAEFKRRQACPILRLQRRAFGIGRQYPIAHRWIVV